MVMEKRIAVSDFFKSWIVLQDNVFVQLLCSIQYRVIKENADDAFYELQNPQEQIQAYVFDGSVLLTLLFCTQLCQFWFLVLIMCCVAWFCVSVTRAIVPRMNLDELFEQKGEVAKAVLEELEKVSYFCTCKRVHVKSICFEVLVKRVDCISF